MKLLSNPSFIIIFTATLIIGVSYSSCKALEHAEGRRRERERQAAPRIWLRQCVQHRPLADCQRDWDAMEEGRDGR